jgi:hypothetical protein
LTGTAMPNPAPRRPRLNPRRPPPHRLPGATVNYTILQNLRDAVIVTSCGAEALPFINGFCVLPASLLFFLYFDKLVGPGPGGSSDRDRA